METSALQIDATAEPIAEMDRLGDEIAELSAHLDAATAHLLDLIRAFDARSGWSHGFRSCAHWLAWRASGWISAPPASGSAWRAPSARCPGWPMRSPTGSCPTPRCGR